jgi:hypothetical protein
LLRLDPTERAHGRSGGLQWEIDRIRELNLEARLVLLFPPVGEDELARRWLEFQRGWPDPGGTTLLPRPALAAVLDPDAPGGATVITGDLRDEVGYRVAIEAAAKRLGINPVDWDLMPRNEPASGRALPTPKSRGHARTLVVPGRSRAAVVSIGFGLTHPAETPALTRDRDRRRAWTLPPPVPVGPLAQGFGGATR